MRKDKCPQCGGEMLHDVDGHCYHCTECGTDWTLEALLRQLAAANERIAELTVEQECEYDRACVENDVDVLQSELAAANERAEKAERERDEAQAACAAYSHPTLNWVDGEPSKVYRDEWFIAETTYGDRVVLRALPEEYTYDYRTADGTYIKADKIKRWMQFPDSEYLPKEWRIVEAADVDELARLRTDNAGLRAALVGLRDEIREYNPTDIDLGPADAALAGLDKLRKGKNDG